ncbi:MAG: dethiobiotin synthase, partial [Burkholderiales bacterium]
ALLTVDAIAARRLEFAGWIANRIDPSMAAFSENVGALKERIPFPCLGVFDFDPRASPEALAKRLKPSLWLA